jgi:hypothetical protein
MRCLEIQQPQMLESLKDDLSAPFADHTFDDAGGRISQKCKKRKTWSQNCVKDLIAPGRRDPPTSPSTQGQGGSRRPGAMGKPFATFGDAPTPDASRKNHSPTASNPAKNSGFEPTQRMRLILINWPLSEVTD